MKDKIHYVLYLLTAVLLLAVFAPNFLQERVAMSTQAIESVVPLVESLQETADSVISTADEGWSLIEKIATGAAPLILIFAGRRHYSHNKSTKKQNYAKGIIR